MELTNEFDVSAPIDETWRILTDIELIAPCMPGAQLTEVDGDSYKGTVKIKVGPITAQFKGVASFVEQDADAHRAVLRAEGRDTTGKGNANATITANLGASDAGGTHVTITTDLAISGRVAQFGRGALADVSTKLLGQFVTCLETRVLSGENAQTPTESSVQPDAAANGSTADGSTATAEDARPAPAPTPTAASADPASRPKPGPGPRKIESAEAEAIDLLGTAGAPLVKRLAPVGALVIVLLLLLRRHRSR